MYIYVRYIESSSIKLQRIYREVYDHKMQPNRILSIYCTPRPGCFIGESFIVKHQRGLISSLSIALSSWKSIKGLLEHLVMLPTYIHLYIIYAFISPVIIHCLVEKSYQTTEIEKITLLHFSRVHAIS